MGRKGDKDGSWDAGQTLEVCREVCLFPVHFWKAVLPKVAKESVGHR